MRATEAITTLHPGDPAFLRDRETRKSAVVEVLEVWQGTQDCVAWVRIRTITPLWSWDIGSALPDLSREFAVHAIDIEAVRYG